MKKFVAVLALLICSVLHAETWPLAAVKGAVPISGRHVAVLLDGEAFVGMADHFHVDPIAATLSYDEGGAPGPAQQGGQQPRPIRTTLETTWISTDGTTQVVRTHCEVFTDVRDCAQTHRAAVDAMKAVFPPRQ